MKTRKSHRRTVAISGYYGYGNIGDEAVLRSILCGLCAKLPGCRVYVLSSDRSSLPDIDGIEIIPKDRRDPVAVIGALLDSQLFISGGGSLLQDKTSAKSLSYYCALLHLAKLCRCKIFVFANGIGPLKNEKKCKRALCLADVVSVRDEDSLAIARRLMQKKGAPILSADPLFAHPFENRRHFLSPIRANGITSPYFAVSLRTCTDGSRTDTAPLEKAFLTLRSEGLTPVFVSMQDSFDLKISRELADKVGGTVAHVQDASELYYLLEKASFAVGMRLHFLLTAAMAGTPSVALSYDCKVDSCMRGLGVRQVLDGFSPTADELIAAVRQAKSEFSKPSARLVSRQ